PVSGAMPAMGRTAVHFKMQVHMSRSGNDSDSRGPTGVEHIAFPCFQDMGVKNGYPLEMDLFSY
ncbi:MAG: hypothetical protein LRY35_05120, partial [Clostridiales bacterium]|nr:hypothetical protein [Clostridiales bacterium]